MLLVIVENGIMGMITWLSEKLKKLKRTSKKKESKEVLIPNYVKKLEERFDRCLGDEYYSLKCDGFDRKVIKKTLITFCKSK